jgi:hypothetical protein
MKNIIVANHNPSKSNSAKSYNLDHLKKNVIVQIENSLQLGWDKKDLWIITNFPFIYNHIGAIQLNLNTNCLTGSKIFAMRELFRLNAIDSPVWIHDLDAWQNENFSFPKIKHAGLAEYSKPKFNGGSMFYTPEAKDIIEDIANTLERDKQKREEPTLDALMRSRYKDRTTIVNPTYNVGCSGFTKRFDRAEKPIKVIHMHPTNRIAWDTHFRGRNGEGYVSGSKRLKDLFYKFYKKEIDGYSYGDKTNAMNIRTDWTK